MIWDVLTEPRFSLLWLIAYIILTPIIHDIYIAGKKRLVKWRSAREGA